MSNQLSYSSEQIIDKMINDLGINPTIIYCQTTGAPIGSISEAHFQILLSMLPANMDLEAICDDLFIRTITSMRPSPAFNLIRGESYNFMRKSAPRELASALLGRLYRPKDGQYSNLKRSLAQRLADGQKQILLFNQLSCVDFNSNDGKWFLHHLVELDTQFDLTLIDSLAEFPTDSTQLDFSTSLETYNSVLSALIQTLHARKDRLERKAMLHQSWLAAGGNRQLREAYQSSFMELEPSKTAQLAREKSARLGSLRMLLREIMAEPIENQTPVSPPAKFEPGITPSGMPRLRLNLGAIK